MLERRKATTVRVIPANIVEPTKQIKKKKRVAAYCRVSSDSAEQQTSFDIQVKTYSDMIERNKDWELVKVYADDGISGTSQKGRNDFQEMVSTALAGKIDMIITKSISRFARNTVDALKTIRDLREKNVDVFFEKEHIHTVGQGGDLLITILSGQAEAESYNISEAVKWGRRKLLRYGKARMAICLLGYKRDEKTDEIVIVEKEAIIVRQIYRLFLTGYSFKGIARELARQGIKTKRGCSEWGTSTIISILKNEKYCGDWLAQKSYSQDFLTHKQVKNNGVLDQYYFEDHHPAIISKELYKQTQLEIERRGKRTTVGARGTKKKGCYTSKYVLSSLLICKKCGNPFSRVHWSHRNKVVWRCMSRIRYGTRYCKDSPTLEEEKLKNEILLALNRMVGNQEEFIDKIIREYQHVLYDIPDELEVGDLKAEIEKLKMDTASEIQGIDQQGAFDLMDKKLDLIAQKAKLIEDKIMIIDEKETMKIVYEQRRKELEDIIHQSEGKLLEWDEYLIRNIIDKIEVIDPSEIDIILKSGHTIKHIMTKRQIREYKRN